jgi:phosphopantothenoylcysteine decarboxylase/phosphopantothenate--cysteine ligase
VSGPVALDAPCGVRVSHIVSASEMLDSVLNAFSWCDALVMSAAVSDWRPRTMAAEKLKKRDMAATLELERTPDILMSVARVKQNQIVVGFAAETQSVLKNAREKLKNKRLDMIIANQVGRGFGFDEDENSVVILCKNAKTMELPKAQKTKLARQIIQEIYVCKNVSVGSDL